MVKEDEEEWAARGEEEAFSISCQGAVGKTERSTAVTTEMVRLAREGASLEASIALS